MPHNQDIVGLNPTLSFFHLTVVYPSTGPTMCSRTWKMLSCQLGENPAKWSHNWPKRLNSYLLVSFDQSIKSVQECSPLKTLFIQRFCEKLVPSCRKISSKKFTLPLQGCWSRLLNWLQTDERWWLEDFKYQFFSTVISLGGATGLHWNPLYLKQLLKLDCSSAAISTPIESTDGGGGGGGVDVDYSLVLTI